MVARIHPINTIEKQPLNNSDDTTSTNSKDSTYGAKGFSRSIKFCLIFMISGLVVLSVMILSAIWLSSFGPAIAKSSSTARDNELLRITQYIETTFNEIVMSSENIKQQLLGDKVDPYNEQITEVKTFNGYKSLKKNHEGVIVSSYIGDQENYCFGTINWGQGSAQFNITRENQKIYYCKDWENLNYCNRNQKPDEVSGFFDLSVLMNICKKNSNALAFSPSYADPSMPQFTFVSLVNCVSTSSTTFWYYAMDLTTNSISAFLKKRTSETPGERSFIVETLTGYLISVGDDTVLSSWDSNGNLIRETAFTVKDEEINNLAMQAFTLRDNWQDFECNKIQITTTSSDYVSVFRLCTTTQIDFVIVLAFPQWLFIGSTVIAVVSSLIGSLLIVSVGVTLGIIVSLKIVKPFRNLIDLFENVSNMELENLDMKPSFFSEVKSLQKHFVSMVNRIKLYRSFIPSHILSQIETANNEFIPSKDDDIGNKSSIASHDSSKKSGSESGLFHNSSKKKTNNNVDRFALYLESRKMTVIQVKFFGLDQVILDLEHQHMIQLLREFFDNIHAACKVFGAHVSNLEIDSVYISLNASSNQVNHEEKAAQIAKNLEERLSKLRMTRFKTTDFMVKKPSLWESIQFRFAIHRMETVCGNVGTNDCKNFTVMGSSRVNLGLLMEMAEKLNTSIVISEPVHFALANAYQTRLLDVLDFAHDKLLASTIHPNQLDKKVTIFELGQSNQVTEDEWMYEMAQKEMKEKWKLYNQGVEQYLSMKFPQALELFQQFYRNNPTDNAVEYMIGKCQESIK